MYALIMAGGVGARFWPKSRALTPKHLLSIINEKNMLENTVDRLDSLVSNDNCYVITNETQKPLVLESVSSLKEENIIAEPFGRNTAAAVGYGALKILLEDKNATMIVLPADHFIRDKEGFTTILKKAVDFADYNPESLITIGIEPTHPETGYGYIQIGDELKDSNGIYNVKTFAEKPNILTAVRFLEDGDFYWNSGMFIWKAEAILSEIKKHIPALYKNLMELKEILLNGSDSEEIKKIYDKIESISIDYGVMEKADSVKVLKGNFGWSDVGSWNEIYKLKEKSSKDRKGNVIEALGINIDTSGCYISSNNQSKLIATIGLKDLAIIDTEDSLMITPLDRSQEVKNIVEEIKKKQLTDLL